MSKRYVPADGDLIVRKFYRPAILTATGISRLSARGLKVEFTNEAGESVWEYASELRKRGLYSEVAKVSKLKSKVEALWAEIYARTTGGLPNVQVSA